MQQTYYRSESDRSVFEAEVIPGLEALAAAELRQRLRRRVHLLPQRREGLLPFGYNGDPAALLDLRTVLAISTCDHYDIPRPKALLGQSAFDRLLATLTTIRALHPGDAFTTQRISAAGADSSVLRRLREELSQQTGLEDVSDEGDLLLRLRRPLDGSAGWDVLVRLSPRPLSARAWRVCNLAGALNASVAAAMAQLTQPHADDAVINLCCGSATLLIERLALQPARIALGCDHDAAALACAQENIVAAGYDSIALEAWDAGALPTPDAWADAVLADLPFGQLVGSHATNVVLYPRILREATRITIGGGRCVALTQDIRLWQRLVADAAADWIVEAELPIKVPSSGGYTHPRIFVLRRR
jgi:tRNA (guanine6-N2)-methyltransferase